MPLIRLRPSHTRKWTLQHPLFTHALASSDEKLQALAEAAAKDPSRRDELVLSLRFILKNLVQRYLFNWPASRRFQDDMVSEGFVALSSLSSEISVDMLKDRTIIKIASRRIQDTINRFLNRYQSLAAPGMTKQKELVAKGRSTVYKSGRDVDTVPHRAHPPEDGDEWKRDMLETLRKMQPKDEIDAALLDRFNWGRGHQELADELGVGVGTIHRRKARLYKQYLELTR